MICTAIDTFYLTDEQLQNSPSRKDGIDEATETTLRIYGCDLIQESGILLKLPQAVMATGQVLFHRFYCKKSFARFNVKDNVYMLSDVGSDLIYLQRVAASCVWLASKLEESPRKARQVLIVFHRMECRRENLPIEHLDTFPKYVFEELNVKSIVPCNDPLKYASLRAEPEFSVLGKRLGKSMPVVAKEVKAMSQEDILAFEKSGEITVAAHSLKLTDIKFRESC
ncbi:hypothetical protein ACSBR2_005309 [Camellia fascicularis]